ncbi:MAG: hypothetical protein C9356_10455 [Oleiphilus sp.]|nr:MAG: hypothetical protein C9356_10455 [Oleiphilus sp.]
MKKHLNTTLVAMALAMFSHATLAADVKGSVTSSVAAGVVLQKNTGIANKNEALLGSVTGKSTSIGGNFSANVKTAAVIQTNTGIANKNELVMGSVTD